MDTLIITLLLLSPFILFLTIISVIKYRTKQRQIQKAVEKALEKQNKSFKDEYWG